MDYALFYLRQSEKREQALGHFEQAYLIYENYYEHQPNSKGSEIIADSAIQVATLLEEQNRLSDAQHYVEIAYQKYLKVF